MNATVAPTMLTHSSNFSTLANGGSSWVTMASPTLPCVGLGHYRSTPYTMIDPKAARSLQAGTTGGGSIESMITESAIEITARDSMLRYMAGQLYDKARPTTTYNFPRVMAPNIPPFPGDPIVISDSILGLSTSGNQVVLTTCGDMTYQWGNMDSGGYEAPTMLSIQATGKHARYR